MRVRLRNVGDNLDELPVCSESVREAAETRQGADLGEAGEEISELAAHCLVGGFLEGELVGRVTHTLPGDSQRGILVWQVGIVDETLKPF